MRFGVGLKSLTHHVLRRCHLLRPDITLSTAQGMRQSQAMYLSASASTSSTSPSGEGFASKPGVNLNGLRKEANRNYLRVVKKVGKASDRLKRAEVNLEDFLKIEEPTQADFERCPNPETCAAELAALKERLTSLQELEEALSGLKNDKDDGYDAALTLAVSLGISDTPPTMAPKGPSKKGKKRGIPPPPRKPFFVYKSADNIEIRVGRRAEDNDELSCNPAYRDGSDWWLHAQGHAGSHVVIRTHDDDLPVNAKETLLDAAALAAVNSKAPSSGKIPVSFTRCRYVSKPAGAKPGLVRLTSNVGTIKVHLSAEDERLKRLEQTKEVNK